MCGGWGRFAPVLRPNWGPCNWEKFLPSLMFAALLIWGLSMLFFSGGSVPSVEQDVGADTPASLPSPVERLKEVAGGND